MMVSWVVTVVVGRADLQAADPAVESALATTAGAMAVAVVAHQTLTCHCVRKFY